jgi:hypothetical protein
VQEPDDTNAEPSYDVPPPTVTTNGGGLVDVDDDDVVVDVDVDDVVDVVVVVELVVVDVPAAELLAEEAAEVEPGAPCWPASVIVDTPDSVVETVADDDPVTVPVGAGPRVPGEALPGAEGDAGEPPLAGVPDGVGLACAATATLGVAAGRTTTPAAIRAAVPPAPRAETVAVLPIRPATSKPRAMRGIWLSQAPAPTMRQRRPTEMLRKALTTSGSN